MQLEPKVMPKNIILLDQDVLSVSKTDPPGRDIRKIRPIEIGLGVWQPHMSQPHMCAPGLQALSLLPKWWENSPVVVGPFLRLDRWNLQFDEFFLCHQVCSFYQTAARCLYRLRF